MNTLQMSSAPLDEKEEGARKKGEEKREERGNVLSDPLDDNLLQEEEVYVELLALVMMRSPA